MFSNTSTTLFFGAFSKVSHTTALTLLFVLQDIRFLTVLTSAVRNKQSLTSARALVMRNARYYFLILLQ
jgi:hypothetical protein